MTASFGDKLRVPGPLGTQHYGIYVGAVAGLMHGVVHNAKGYGVILSEFKQFAAGKAVTVEARVSGDWWAQQEVVRRALGLLGTRYDLINFNCEHAATLAQTGRATSAQVSSVVMAALMLLGLYALSEA